MTDTFALIRSAQTGDRTAGERLVRENSGLIWSVVKRYDWGKYDPEDLYQLGCLGFLKAVEGFDPDYGTQFSTYAVPKIAGEIRRFLRDDGPVKVSRGRKEQALLIQKARRDLTAALGREPVLSELSAETGLTPEDIAAADLAAAGESAADAVLLDNGYGTGEAFDWSLAADFKRPFALAGGLTPENIPEAVAAMRPLLVDISSGVETDKIKDRTKILAAVRAAREA